MREFIFVEKKVSTGLYFSWINHGPKSDMVDMLSTEARSQIRTALSRRRQSPSPAENGFVFSFLPKML